jgi:hypothetical protein
MDVNRKPKTKQRIFQKAKKISNTDSTNKKPGMKPDAREGKAVPVSMVADIIPFTLALTF